MIRPLILASAALLGLSACGPKAAEPAKTAAEPAKADPAAAEKQKQAEQ